MKTIDWDMTKLLCDKCLALYEADKERLIEDFCQKCYDRILRWGRDVMNTRPDDLPPMK